MYIKIHGTGGSASGNGIALISIYNKSGVRILLNHQNVVDHNADTRTANMDQLFGLSPATPPYNNFTNTIGIYYVIKLPDEVKKVSRIVIQTWANKSYNTTHHQILFSEDGENFTIEGEIIVDNEPLQVGHLEKIIPSYLSRILLSSDTGDVYSVIKESSENIVPVMTSNTEPSGEVNASHQYSPAWGAFDGGTSYWYANNTPPVGGHWLQYKFEEPQSVQIIGLSTQSISGSNYGIRNFKILGSNDGVNFTELYSGIFPNGTNELLEFNFTNVNRYLIYRIQGDSYHGVNFMLISDFKMHSSNLLILKQATSQTPQDFIEHGLLSQELFEIDFSDIFIEKRYITTNHTLLGEGKVFEQPLDANKIIKSVKINR